jgi:hypothetical protein
VRIEELTISTGSTRQHENAVFEIEMFNESRFAQPFGNFFRVVVLCLERIHQIQTDQISKFDLDGHGAAIGSTGVAQAIAVSAPGFTAVNVHNRQRRFHGGCFRKKVIGGSKTGKGKSTQSFLATRVKMS